MTEKQLQPHIKLKDVDKICLIAGNPDRIPVIASYLKKSEKVAEHRGLIAYKGVTPIKKNPCYGINDRYGLSQYSYCIRGSI